MKTIAIQQEIMLVPTSTFSQREWCNKSGSNKKNQLSHIEQLEEACWNGMLEEVLPEIIERSSSGRQLYLWHIRRSESLLMELSEFPVSIEKPLSIDPFFFLLPSLNN